MDIGLLECNYSVHGGLGMPTYVYRCRNCQETIEVVQRFSDDPLQRCPHCGGSLSRLLFPPAIVFKGSGWYCTDNRRGGSSGNGSNGDSESGGEKAKKEREHALSEE